MRKQNPKPNEEPELAFRIRFSTDFLVWIQDIQDHSSRQLLSSRRWVKIENESVELILSRRPSLSHCLKEKKNSIKSSSSSKTQKSKLTFIDRHKCESIGGRSLQKRWIAIAMNIKVVVYGNCVMQFHRLRVRIAKAINFRAYSTSMRATFLIKASNRLVPNAPPKTLRKVIEIDFNAIVLFLPRSIAPRCGLRTDHKAGFYCPKRQKIIEKEKIPQIRLVQQSRT